MGSGSAPTSAERQRVFRRAVIVGAGLCGAAVVVGCLATPWLFLVLMSSKFSAGLDLAFGCALAFPFQALGVYVGFCVRAMGQPGRALVVDYCNAGVVISTGLIVVVSGGPLQFVPLAFGIGGACGALTGIWMVLHLASAD